MKDRFVTCFTYYYMRPLNGSFEILRLQHSLRNMFYISAVHMHIFFVLKQALRKNMQAMWWHMPLIPEFRREKQADL